MAIVVHFADRRYILIVTYKDIPPPNVYSASVMSEVCDYNETL